MIVNHLYICIVYTKMYKTLGALKSKKAIKPDEICIRNFKTKKKVQ